MSSITLRRKTKLFQPVYKGTIETVWENSAIHPMACLGLRLNQLRFIVEGLEVAARSVCMYHRDKITDHDVHCFA